MPDETKKFPRGSHITVTVDDAPSTAAKPAAAPDERQMVESDTDDPRFIRRALKLTLEFYDATVSLSGASKVDYNRPDSDLTLYPAAPNPDVLGLTTGAQSAIDSAVLAAFDPADSRALSPADVTKNIQQYFNLQTFVLKDEPPGYVPFTKKKESANRQVWKPVARRNILQVGQSSAIQWCAFQASPVVSLFNSYKLTREPIYSGSAVTPSVPANRTFKIYLVRKAFVLTASCETLVYAWDVGLGDFANQRRGHEAARAVVGINPFQIDQYIAPGAGASSAPRRFARFLNQTLLQHANAQASFNTFFQALPAYIAANFPSPSGQPAAQLVQLDRGNVSVGIARVEHAGQLMGIMEVSGERFYVWRTARLLLTGTVLTSGGSMSQPGVSIGIYPTLIYTGAESSSAGFTNNVASPQFQTW